jgi:hypothetical protein
VKGQAEMIADRATTNGQMRELTIDEGWRVLDARAQRYLRISGDEFLRRWDQGQYRGEDSPEVLRVVMALPFIRR